MKLLRGLVNTTQAHIRIWHKLTMLVPVSDHLHFVPVGLLVLFSFVADRTHLSFFKRMFQRKPFILNLGRCPGSCWLINQVFPGMMNVVDFTYSIIEEEFFFLKNFLSKELVAVVE